jgi:hypothetical protein
MKGVFPVGILIPNSIAKFEQLSTAAYKRASSFVLQAHIQFAEMKFRQAALIGAQTIFDKASAIWFYFLQQDLKRLQANAP